MQTPSLPDVHATAAGGVVVFNPALAGWAFSRQPKFLLVRRTSGIIAVQRDHGGVQHGPIRQQSH
jgi:hypothetical protein